MRRERLLAQRLAAQRAGAVRRVDEAPIGQRQQLRAQRVVEQAAEIGRRPPERHAQIRTPDIADEQRVAGQHGMRLRLAPIQIVDDDGDRFGGVTGCLEGRQLHAAEFDDVAVAQLA